MHSQRGTTVTSRALTPSPQRLFWTGEALIKSVGKQVCIVTEPCIRDTSEVFENHVAEGLCELYLICEV